MSAPTGPPAVTVLSTNHFTLRRYDYPARAADGSETSVMREVYDCGDGATVLLYNRARRSVILTRQFRMPAYVAGAGDGLLIETPAGLLDDEDAANAVAREAEEETGYRIGAAIPLFDLFMSPGALNQRVHFFVAEVRAEDRVGPGGGLAEEHEDIDVLEVGFDDALAMLGDGRIRDAKTALLLLHAQANGLFDA